MQTKLYNGPLQSLLNGSGINNIPLLNIMSTNPAVSQANNCSKGPVYIGSQIATDMDCIQTCVNDSAKVTNVLDGETVAFNNTLLRPGAHCFIGPRPECNMKTSYALMTVNSVTCVSKFPRLFGGDLGTEIVACNNKNIYDPNNVLWDYKSNEAVNPWTTTIIDTDEQLNDGSFRFRCKFDGEDYRGNKYIPHPKDRFHPIINYCASLIYRAHPDVKTIFQTDDTFACDCGDEQETRVKHMYADNPSSQCASIQYKVESLVGDKKRVTLPYKCFTLFSTLAEVGSSPPCPEDLFTRQGNQVSSVSLEFTENERSLIEHPIYQDLTDDGVTFKENVEMDI